MILSWQRTKQSLSAFPELFSQYSVAFIGMHLINFFFNQMMTYLQEQRMTSKEDFFVPVMIAVALVGFVVQSVIKVIWTLMICYRFEKQKKSLTDFLKHTTEQSLIESLRSFFRALLWGFVLIIPGIIKFIQYQFVVFVVALNKDYDEGHVDALKASAHLTRGLLLQLIALLAIFGIASLFTTSSDLLVNAPFSVILLEVISFCLTTIELTYLYLLYKDLQKAQGTP